MIKNLPFIHPSYANENNLEEDNQRLEFLGDALLGFIVSEFLYNQFEKEKEGFLSNLKANLVCNDTFAKFAKKLKLDENLLLSFGEEKNGGRDNPAILSDTFEAYIAYFYLKKGIKKTRKLVEELLREFLNEKKNFLEKLDPKSHLQQILQKNKFPLPEYRAGEPQGPPHKPIFKVEVYIDGKYYGTGTGSSKKEAEMKAAEEAIKNIEKEI